MKKVVSIILCILFVVGGIPVSVSANSRTYVGTVVEVVDGEAIKVKSTDGAIIWVRLIGVKTNASKEALEYMVDATMGRQVRLESDSASIYLDRQNSPWKLMYVYRLSDSSLMNGELLEKGLGKLDIEHKSLSKYSELSRQETRARSRRIGVWENERTNYYEEDRVNINTATASQLRQWLNGVSSTVAQNIIKYREKNPFNSIKEIKYVKGFNKDLFDQNRYRMTVVTNINMAGEQELRSLAELSTSDINSIIDYRKSKDFSSAYDLYRQTKITYSQYTSLSSYISVEDVDTIDVIKDSIVVNVNTASRDQLYDISGISSENARRIVEYRNNDIYSYKTLLELEKIPYITLSVEDIHGLEDNLHLYTDINTANESELKSLFGSNYVASEIKEIKEKRPFTSKEEIRNIVGTSKYHAIKDFIYIDSYSVPDRVNINLASRAQLSILELVGSLIDRMLEKQMQYRTGKDILADYSTANHKISLYTNINAASDSELKTLHRDLTTSMIQKIVDYREDQPFGSGDEIEEFFEKQGISNIYRNIKDFIVIR